MREINQMKYLTKPPKLQLIAAMSLLLAGSGACLASEAAAAATTEKTATETASAVAEAAEVEAAAAAHFALQVAEQEAQIAEAQRQVAEASRAMAEASKALEEERKSQHSNLERSRAELSRAHRALREASREVAMAHRDAEMGRRFTTRVQTINLGDSAIIGVLLGESSERGVMLSGVSPGGPAEEAGLKKGDLLTSIRETDLTDQEDDAARHALVETMSKVEAGEEIRIGFLRNGKHESVMVKAEKREPSSWQSFITLPEAPPPPPPPGAPSAPPAHPAPAGPGARVWVQDVSSPRIVVDHVQTNDGKSKVVVINDEALADRIAEIESRVESFQYMFTDDEGNSIHFNEEIEFDDDQLSDIGANALNQANMWFGMSHTSGLELTSCNPELGEYFKTDRGVLVLNVNADNSYGLKAGDVILWVAEDEVNTPAELIRALRNFEPGAKFELQIKRDRRDKTLQATLPDSRLGALMEFGRAPEHFSESGNP